MKPKSFEAFFNGLDHINKIRIANRRIQKLDADLAFIRAFKVDTTDEWFLYSEAELADKRQRWYDVRDRLVWDLEEVTLS